MSLWIFSHLSKEEKSVMLRLRQKLLLWMGFESQEERLRWLESELKRLRLSRELRSVVHELVDEGEGLGPRWREVTFECLIVTKLIWNSLPEQLVSPLCPPILTVFSF